MLKVRIGTRDDSSLVKSPAEFYNIALEGELFVDAGGGVYVSAYITNTPSITLLDLRSGRIFRLEGLEPDVWPLRRLHKSETVTLQNGE